MIEHLPTDSDYIEALANDPDIADAIDQGLIDPPEIDNRPALRDWDMTATLLAAIHDLLGSLLSAQVASATGGKHVPSIKPHPRPWTAVGQAVLAARRRKHNDKLRELVSILTPDHRPEWLYRDETP